MSLNIWAANFRELSSSWSSAAWHTYRLALWCTRTPTCVQMHIHTCTHFHINTPIWRRSLLCCFEMEMFWPCSRENSAEGEKKNSSHKKLWETKIPKWKKMTGKMLAIANKSLSKDSMWLCEIFRIYLAKNTWILWRIIQLFSNICLSSSVGPWKRG